MKVAHESLPEIMLPRLPIWISPRRSVSTEDTVFLSGAALAHLQVLIDIPAVPISLVCERLALKAAETCVAISGRPEREADLRDAIHLLRAGDQAGPAGEVYQIWKRAVERPLSIKTVQRALPMFSAEQIRLWMEPADGTPVARASGVIEAVLADHPRNIAAALVLADVAVAQTFGWSRIVPLLSVGLRARDLRLTGDDLRFACHGAMVVAVKEADRLIHDLTRRAARLQDVAPKLRAKGAADAVELFMTRDALAPSALPLPDRAARRLCDRLVALGAVRELTGRDTFRLYGV